MALRQRVARMIAFTLFAIAGFLSIVISLTIGWRPIVGPRARPLTNIRFESTPEGLERGRYLVEHVAGCFFCHTKFDATGETPRLISKKGSGQVISEDADLRLVAQNITPDPETGIGNWSDDALARAIREGVSRDGRALFPAMPYNAYSHMSDEDLASVIVYMRSIEPARNDVPRMRMPFLVSRLINKAPQPITEPVPQPDLSDPVRRGAYLAQVAGCGGCHTPRRGPRSFEPKPGFEFAGGATHAGVAGANITPDPSGISYYDEHLFLEVMRTGRVGARKLDASMPWYLYRNMTDEDLKALFAYLRTLRPVRHRVDNTEPPTKCKICGGTHGLGEQN